MATMYGRFSVLRVFTLGFLLVAGVAAAAIPSHSGAHLQSSSGCHVNDHGDTILVNMIKGDVAGTDSLGRTLLKLPRMSADSVTGISNSTTCQRAALAYGRNLVHPDTTTARQVYVIRAGATRYVVIDPTVMGGELTVAMTFDSTFTTAVAKAGL